MIIVAVVFYFIGSHGNRCQANGETTFANSTGNDVIDGRLPRHIEPILYKIELFPDIYGPDPAAFKFNGTMWLQFKCLVKSYNITMNVNKLDIWEISINEMTSSEGPGIRYATNFTIDEQWQMLIIFVSVPFEAGLEYYVEISYHGDLKEDFAGLYLSKFKHKPENPYVAATQFSPTDARKAFPCFDEPDRKAEFEITIVRRNDLISLSNMPKLMEEQRGHNFVADIYERTPRMSTYLLAMVVGDFHSLTVPARPGLNYTSWAWEGNINKTKRGLHFGAQVLSHFEDYFGNTFPLPKQDMLAVPETAVGAMENWGLIIFRQGNIFYEERKFSDETLLQSSVTIAHELAHQWFGNLVTMSWWSQLMLKEGFAVYFAEVGIDKVHPDWNVLDQFAVRIMHNVFETDSLESSHPLEMELRDTTQIRQVFDSISYSKGGSIIRMLNFLLGPEAFQAGLRNYLETHKYENVGFEELWKSVEPNDWYGPRVDEIMNSWILQKNYPVVSIKQLKPGFLHISQERFLINPDGNKADAVDGKVDFTWKIPFTFTSSVEANFTVDHSIIIWLEYSDMVIVDREIPDLKTKGNWVIGNLQQQGYYRMNYDSEVWGSIVDQLKENRSKIHHVNRAQIINDLFSLAKAKKVTLGLALRVLEYLYQEGEYVPWSAALKELNFMDKLVKHTTMYDKYKTVCSYLVNDPLLRLEKERESSNISMSMKLMYADLYSLGSLYGIQRCVEKAKSDFEGLKDNSTKYLDPGTRTATLCAVLKESSSEDWLFVLQLYNTTINLDEKDAYLYALTCTKNGSLHEKIINLTQDSFTMKGSEAVTTLSRLARNPSALSKVWNYLTSRWDYFLEKFSGSLFQLASLVKGITGEFTTKEQLNALELFVNNTKSLGPAKQTFAQAIERTKGDMEWIAENIKTLEQWMDQMIRQARP